MRVESRPPHLLRNLIVGLLFLFGLVAFSALYTGGAIASAQSAGGTVPVSNECETEDGGAVRCKMVGRVNAMPNGMMGVWTIGGESFNVTANTEIRQEHGPLAMNACVSVHYTPSANTPYEALLLKTKSNDDCNGNGGDHGGDHDGPQAEAKGAIQAMNVDADLLGVWTVNGVDYTVDAQTIFMDLKSQYTVGACVEIKYDSSTSPYMAYRIKLDNDCNGGGGGDGGGDHGNHESDIKGKIDALPNNADLLGVWTVNGTNYTVDAQTVFMDAKSQYTVGACVEVKYDSSTSPYVAYRIKLDNDCNGNGGGDDGGDHGNHDNEFRGAIESLPPSGLIGTWTVRGTEFNVTANTRLEAEYGAFAPGLCVEIKYDATTTPYTALKIEGKREYECGNSGGGGDGGGDHQGEGELYGMLQSFPAGLIGEWQVGNLTFQADSSTRFEQEHGQFAVGAMVKVEFYTTADGVNHAKEIKVKYEGNGDGGDHGGDHGGSYEGAEGNAYGAIDTFPANLTGDWVIGGLTYTADASTRFEQEHGQFAQGAWVKVKYHQDANGNRIADKIETENGQAGGGQEQFKLVGFVESMPTTGFMGDWSVGGETFVADNRTQFGEEHGLLAVGAYVELKYTLVNGVKTLHEIHTEVPPGAGDVNDVGEIEDMGGPAAADASAVATWRIDGQNYVINDATRLNDGATPLAVGSTVVVNSYTAADGSVVATSVTGIEISHRVFLPLATSR